MCVITLYVNHIKMIYEGIDRLGVFHDSEGGIIMSGVVCISDFQPVINGGSSGGT
jgi:hypothetical protein